MFPLRFCLSIFSSALVLFKYLRRSWMYLIPQAILIYFKLSSNMLIATCRWSHYWTFAAICKQKWTRQKFIHFNDLAYSLTQIEIIKGENIKGLVNYAVIYVQQHAAITTASQIYFTSMRTWEMKKSNTYITTRNCQTLSCRFCWYLMIHATHFVLCEP